MKNTNRKSILTSVLLGTFLLLSPAHAETPEFKKLYLDGEYDMQIKIGNIDYTDKLILAGNLDKIDLLSFLGDINGQLTIVNTFFTAPLAGTAVCTTAVSYCDLRFEVMITENGQSFKVIYRGHVDAENYLAALNGTANLIIKGIATLENGQILGHFIATKNDDTKRPE